MDSMNTKMLDFSENAYLILIEFSSPNMTEMVMTNLIRNTMTIVIRKTTTTTTMPPQKQSL